MTLLGIANGNQNANRFQDFVREHELGVLAEDHLSEERLRLLGGFLVFLQSGLRRFGNFTLRGSRFGFSGGDGGNGFSGQVFNNDLGHGALLSGYRFNRGTTRTTGSWGNKLAHVRLLKGSFDGRPSAPAQYCTYTRAAFLSTVVEPSLPLKTLCRIPRQKASTFFRIFGTFSKKFFRLQLFVSIVGLAEAVPAGSNGQA